MKTTLVPIKNVVTDWDKPRLVISKRTNHNIVILTAGYHSQGYFEGTVVSSNDKDFPVGKFEEEWDKELYSEYDGKVILEND